MRLLLLAALLGPASAGPETPDCGGTIAGSVVGTLLVLVALQVTAYFVWKAYWKGKKGQHLVLVTDPEKGDSVYAFDNPGFKEGPTILQSEEKENQKLKWAQWNSVGLVPSNNSKVKAMDDSFTAQPTLNVVPLRSHDFTGLGFNICGNMRDGIFVKDVLHRGPASESGRIMPGDRIDSVKISLRHMVLEDALTILSYASPYEVELSVETRSGNTGSLLRTPPPPHRICHPFYRSHSISDLHQIGKSSSKKVGDQPSSLVSDLSGREGSKPSTLDRKPKLIEAERHQNSRNCMIENVQKQENVFHTIELDRDEPDQGKTPKEVTPNNVKSMLVKGIQNLKEKLQHSLHQEEAKEEPKNDSRHSTLDKKQKDDGFKSVDLSVPEEVQRAGVAARTNRKCSVEDIVTDEMEDPVAAKRKKGKAPMPPQNKDDMEIASIESVDSDSESGGDKSGTTIELNSSHITVHHAPESNESRKASSLGDLSRYEAESVAVLERAVSLDLGDGPGGKKRKAPAPPEPSPSDEEPTLKKSSVWGTLQDAINSDSETDLGISGCSTPEKTTSTFNFEIPEEEAVTSTPFKANEHKNFSAFKVGELLTMSPFNLSDSQSSGHFKVNDTQNASAFKLSEPPSHSSFKTVTFSTSVKDDKDELYKMKDIDGLDDMSLSPPKDMEPLDLKSKMEEIVTLSPSREAVSSCSWDMSSDFVTAMNGDDTPPELPTSPMPTLDSYITEIQVTTNSRPSDYIHLDGADQLMDHINIFKFDSSDDMNGAYQSETIVSVDPLKRQEEPEKHTPPPKKSEVIKPARSNVTVTNFKSTPSRIPVRAGPRSPSTSLSPPSDKRNFSHRNGHGSP